MLLVLGITASRAKLIPSRWQGAVEWLIEFVRDNIVYQVMGELRGKRYVPMITTVFCTLLVFNLCGIIPGFNIAASATITLPLVFAMWCFCQYWIAGIREKGLGHFLRDEIFPKGVPAPIYILLSPIQLLELLIIRPFSLTIRLFANMVSGHLILALCLSATQYFLIDVVNKVFMPFGVVTFAAGMFSFLFVDLFDTLGTLIGVASKADMLDEDGKLPHIKGALMADSIATCAGAVLGTSTTTTFVESASGVTRGRPHRSDRYDHRHPVPAGNHLQPSVPHHPVLCNGSGPDHRGLLHDGLCRQDRLQ